jgi:hypothetical protein
MKLKSTVILIACLALGLSSCKKDSTSPAAPEAGDVNLLNGTGSGGTALVVAVTGYDTGGVENVELVYEYDLAVDCTDEWYPQGTLCNADGTADDKDTSTKVEEDSGATWYNYEEDFGATGVLVIDSCSDGSCETIVFVEARVFQMYSDGETTHIRLAIHSETSDNPPPWNDAGWTVINGGFSSIGQGSTEDEGLTVGDPTVINVGSRETRYLRVEARNDGSLLEADYLELRSIKLF